MNQQHLQTLLASHIASHEPMSDQEVGILLGAGLISMDDVMEVPRREAERRGNDWIYVGSGWTAALDDVGPLLIPAIYRGSDAALPMLKRHFAGGPDLEWPAVRYLDLSGVAATSDFRPLVNGRWRHRSVPDRIMHVTVCVKGSMVLGVHAYSDVEEARGTALLFLKTIHGMPETMVWEEWAAMVAFGLAPREARETDVWSIPLEPASDARRQ